MKTRFLLPVATAVLSVGLVGTAQAGKPDDTLNVAIDRELSQLTIITIPPVRASLYPGWYGMRYFIGIQNQ